MFAAELPLSPAASVTVVDRVNETLIGFLATVAGEVDGREPDAAPLIEEIARLVRAGGKRIRPAFCYWGYRAAGGADGEPIVRAASAIELLHTMALVHDDLIDGTPVRRGVATVVPHLGDEARRRGVGGGDPRRYAEAGALLVGDLAAVLADRLFLESGFPSEALARGLAPYHAMRIQMAIGQFLDISGAPPDPVAARRIAALKGGSYTVEGPLLVGADLAGASPRLRIRLERFAAPLGEAFQLRDDLLDRDGRHGATAQDVHALVDEAVKSLDDDTADDLHLHLEPGAGSALRAMARLIDVR